MVGTIREEPVNKVVTDNKYSFHLEHGFGKLVESNGDLDCISSFICESGTYPVFLEDLPKISKITVEYNFKKRRKTWRRPPSTKDEQGYYSLTIRYADVIDLEDLLFIKKNNLINTDVEFEIKRKNVYSGGSSLKRSRVSKIHFNEKKMYSKDELKEHIEEAMLFVSNGYRYEWVTNNRLPKFFEEKNL